MGDCYRSKDCLLQAYNNTTPDNNGVHTPNVTVNQPIVTCREPVYATSHLILCDMRCDATSEPGRIAVEEHLWLNGV